MKPFRWVALLCAMAAAGCAMAGWGSAAGWLWMLGGVVELIGAMFTGKQGNAAQR